jgi:ParB-like chromosome segregation protein Spo0J
VADHPSPPAAGRTLPARLLEAWHASLSREDDLAVDAVRQAGSPRAEAVDQQHVRALADAPLPWPAIIVHRPTMRVVDGRHRLHAARLRGQDSIRARFFDGTEDEAFNLAVQVNTVQGLTLSLAERRSAVTRILAGHPDWSDRAIARIAGLSAKTVAALRREHPDGQVRSPSRIGRDGRVRLVDITERRHAAMRLLEQDPTVSLREAARRTGVSPGTVRDVRGRLDRGEPAAAARRRPARREEPARHHAARRPGPHDAVELADLFQRLCRDPSLRHSDAGRLVLRQLESHLGAAGGPWQRLAQELPPHCHELLTLAALRCAELWQDLASELRADRGQADRGTAPPSRKAAG